MNILISVNESYLDKAQTMLFSLRLHTKGEVVVYLMNHKLSADIVQEFRSYLSKRCNIELVEIDVKNTALDSLPLGKYNFSIEMYYRILAQFLLPSTIDRILWLDADIILLKDISEFYNLPVSKDTMYVVCQDRNAEGELVKKCKEDLGLPPEHNYFNSGVLLMNLQGLRKMTDKETIIFKCLSLKEKLRFPDQDILNALYWRNVQYADWRVYNYQLTGVARILDDEAREIAILHYSGGAKPWDYKCMNRSSKHYWRIRVMQGDWSRCVLAYTMHFGLKIRNFFVAKVCYAIRKSSIPKR